MIPFGTRVKSKRKELKLTQLQLAIKANVTPQTICNIEKGKPFYSSSAILIADALGIDPV